MLNKVDSEHSYLLVNKLLLTKVVKQFFYFAGGRNLEFVVNEKVRKMYNTASEILNFDLYELTINGNSNKFKEMAYLQPAIFVSSLAAIEK